MRLSTRQLTRAAVLVAVALLLSLTPLGNIPVPTPGRAVTITHIPVILAGILLGPLLGGCVGFIWGLAQWNMYAAVIANPLVHIVPRIAVGVVSSLAFRGTYRLAAGTPYRKTLSSAFAAVAGTLTNTIGVLGLAVWLGPFTREMALATAFINLPLELVAAVAVTVPVTAALMGRMSQEGRPT